MGYRHISNLYKNKDILLFKQCYALEKIHGTSAHVSYRADQDKIHFFSGGAKHQEFLSLFDEKALLDMFRKNAAEHPDANRVTIYGEAYGGKMQKMAHTYGPELKFIAFEVLIDNTWLGVISAEKVAQKFGFEFVDYKLINTTEEEINAEMMKDSVQAIRNGMGSGHMREGVVLRPVQELLHPNGGRIICKHKRPEFAERINTPNFTDPAELKILADAKEVAEEWVNQMRLLHILDKFESPSMRDMNKVIAAMVEDVYREAEGEIIPSGHVKKAIGKKTSKLFQTYLKGSK